MPKAKRKLGPQAPWKNGFVRPILLMQNCPTPAQRPVGEECQTMDEHAILPINRLLILTCGAVVSWLAVGGVALGASALVKQLL
jgi:hypothetical protein